MFWFPTEKILRDRETLKKAIEKARESNLPLEEIKKAFFSLGYHDGFAVVSLAGHWFELAAYLGLSTNEWDAMGFPRWMS
jgi:hypothetical protein